MRKLTYGMNLSLDGYISAPGDDIGWSVPSAELFSWWTDRMREVSLSLYGRKLWQTMSAHWPTADQQPGASPADIEFARHWQNTPKVVFSSTLDKVDGNARLVTGDAVAEIFRRVARGGGELAARIDQRVAGDIGGIADLFGRLVGGAARAERQCEGKGRYRYAHFALQNP